MGAAEVNKGRRKMDHNYELHYQFYRAHAATLNDADLESAIDVARRRMRRDAERDEQVRVIYAAVDLDALKDERLKRHCRALRDLRASEQIIAGMEAETNA